MPEPEHEIQVPAHQLCLNAMVQGDTEKRSSPKLEKRLKLLINSFYFSDLPSRINFLRVYQI